MYFFVSVVVGILFVVFFFSFPCKSLRPERARVKKLALWKLQTVWLH